MNGTPACSTKILENDPYIKPRVQKWNDRNVVGCLSYQNAIVRLDITMNHKTMFKVMQLTLNGL